MLSLSMMGSAYAATTGASVSAGQKINLGNYWQSYKNNGGDVTNIQNYNKDVIVWRVLSYDGTDKVATLLSDKALYADAFDSSSCKWSESDLNATLNNTTVGSGFLGDAFTSAEQGLIDTKTYDVLGDTGEVGDYGELNVSSKLYLLDYNDVKDGGTYGSDTASRCTEVTDFAQNVTVYDNTATAIVDSTNHDFGSLWTRSPSPHGGSVVAFYGRDNSNCDYFNILYDYLAVRPALDLNLSKLIFAAGADPVNGSAHGANVTSVKFSEINDTSTLDVFFDDTANANGDRVTGDVSVAGLALDGSDMTIEYSGAKGVGNGEYVSALFFDKVGYEYKDEASTLSTGTLFGYGKGDVEVTATAGTSTITVGDDYKDGEYHVEVFDENGVFIGKRAEIKGFLNVDSKGKLHYTVGADDLAFDVTVGVNNKVILTDGTLVKSIVGEGVTIVDGDVSANAGNIQTKTDIVEEDKALTLTDGKLIADTVVNKGNLKFDGATDVEAEIVGSGDMYIFQSINMKGNLRQSSVNISDGKSFTNIGKVMTETLNADFSKGTTVNTSGEFISDKVVSVGMNSTMKAENTVAVGNNTIVSGSNLYYTP